MAPNPRRRGRHRVLRRSTLRHRDHHWKRLFRRDSTGIDRQQKTAPPSGPWTRLKARTMTEQVIENLQKEMGEIKGKLSEFDEMKEQIKLLVKMVTDKGKTTENSSHEVPPEPPFIEHEDEKKPEMRYVLIPTKIPSKTEGEGLEHGETSGKNQKNMEEDIKQS
ncbi:hypothetical protein LINGRAHAP2_LOCUS11262 [Linum grandiflorum]